MADTSPFDTFLYELRGSGLSIGIGEWGTFLGALERGLATNIDDLYRIGRAILCRSETEFDDYDMAFARTFTGAQLSPEARQRLTEWLQKALDARPPDGDLVQHDRSLEDLWKELLERLREQTGRHEGGNRWVGTGGTSPYGNSGKAADGIAVGGEGSGGRTGAVAMAQERRWSNYRTDHTLDVRDLQVALRALRKLVREGVTELDIDGTISKTAKNAGEIEIVEQRARQNKVHLVMLLDAGGSMSPHHDRVSKLFSAAHAMKTFKTFKTYYFHNCVYQYLFEDISELKRIPTTKVLEDLTPQHRVLFVGDASMAPYELFSVWGWYAAEGQVTGIDWLKRFRDRCKASAWVNPDPPQYWNHPTVSAIGRMFPMYELNVEGLQGAVRTLRAPV